MATALIVDDRVAIGELYSLIGRWLFGPAGCMPRETSLERHWNEAL